MAALCHDLGHLPFSHAAEKQLLPPGWDHERLTSEIILSDEMRTIWGISLRHFELKMLLNLQLAETNRTMGSFVIYRLGDNSRGNNCRRRVWREPHGLSSTRLSSCRSLAYGRFDHYRLIDTLRILPAPPSGRTGQSQETALGVEEGGIESAEALMLARYFMYSQVYFHPVRRIYDIHLMDFLKEWLGGGMFGTETRDHLRMTDNEVTAGILEGAFDESKPGHLHARRIVNREHFSCCTSVIPQIVY